MQETVLASEQLKTDSKIFFLDLKENERGIVLKISEKRGDRRNTIMLPVEGLTEFTEAINRINSYSETLKGS